MDCREEIKIIAKMQPGAIKKPGVNRAFGFYVEWTQTQRL